MAKKDAKESKAKLAVKPLDDRIVVERVEAEEVTKGGIVLPDAAREKSQQATVVAVGPGKLLENGERAKLEVSVGDTILISKYGGTEIKVCGEEYLIVRESDVLAKVV